MDTSTSSETTGRTPRPLLRRNTEHRVIAGVARGLGDHTGLDPLLFRLGFVGLALAGGLGVLLYALAWVAIPRASEVRPRDRASLRRWALFALIGGATVVFFGAGGTEDLFGGRTIVALLLVVIGVLLLRDDSTAGTGSPGGVDTDRIARLLARRRNRKRSPLPWLVIAAALLAVGLAGLLDNLGATSLPPGRYPAIALAVVGLGLLIATRYGRARILILIGLLLLPVAFVASPITVPLKGPITSRYESPRFVHDLEDRYDVLYGDVVLDLGQLRRRELHKDIEVAVNSVAGQVTAYVPEWMDLSVKGSIDIGSYHLSEGSSDSGVDLAFSQDAPGTRDMGSVALNVRGGMVALNVITLGEKRIWASQAAKLRREAARYEMLQRLERRRERARQRTLRDRRRLREQLERLERRIDRLDDRGGRRG
jgi:phage shock protein PspC (stress-responsive transcriptional regulator)